MEKLLPLLGIETIEEICCRPNFSFMIFTSRKISEEKCKVFNRKKSMSASHNEGFVEKKNFSPDQKPAPSDSV